MSRGATARKFLKALFGAALVAAAAKCAPPPEIDPDAGATLGPVPVAVDPAPGSVDVLTDKVIRIQFSDHLSGRSVSRYRFKLYSGPINHWVMSYYDPVRGELVVWPSSTMRSHAVYVLELEEGLEGLDDSPVLPGEVTRFTTGDEGGDNLPFPELGYGQHVEPIFSAHCASCHAGADAVAGVDLASAGGVQSTILNSVSDGWPEWKRAVPDRPGESYLLYKIIGDERISGQPMPRSWSDDQPAAPLHPAEQRTLADWIAGGASFFDPSADDE